MGNCIKKESSMEWGGEDWSDYDYSSDHHLFSNSSNSDSNSNNKKNTKNFNNGSYLISDSSSSSKIVTSPSTTEVKVKITRKQLEELLAKTTKTPSSSSVNNYADGVQQPGGGLSVQELLTQLINIAAAAGGGSHQYQQFNSNQRSWRPALPTISELL